MPSVNFGSNNHRLYSLQVAQTFLSVRISRNVMMLLQCLTATLLPLLSSPAQAEPPAMSFLAPAGMMRGGTVEVTHGGKPGTQPVFAWCSRDDVQISLADEARKLSITTSADAEPGIAWIRLYNAEGASAVRPFMIGLHPEIQETEPNNRVPQAQKIDAATSLVNGSLTGREDVDLFAVPLKAGQTLVASMVANNIIGSPMDGVLQILSADGFVLEQNDDDLELDPRIAFTAPNDGLYHVRVFAFPAATNQSIRLHSGNDYVYRLTLTTGPFVDYAWPLSATAGAAANVNLQGWNLDDSFAAFPVTANVAFGPQQIFDSRLANPINIQSVPGDSVIEGPKDQPQAELTVPVAISGRIEQPSEIDEYPFALKSGQTVEFTVASRELGYPLDPLLSLLTPDGKVLREVDDAGSGIEDATLAQRIEADGVYRLRVQDRFANGGARYVYLVNARLAEPSIKLTVASDAFTIPADKPLEIEVKIERLNGAADRLEITALDLPAGITVTPAISEKDGDSSKAVTIKLEATVAAERPGTFRIVGRVADQPVEHVAKAALAAFKTEMSELWVNVPHPKLPRPPVEAVRPK